MGPLVQQIFGKKKTTKAEKNIHLKTKMTPINSLHFWLRPFSFFCFHLRLEEKKYQIYGKDLYFRHLKLIEKCSKFL